MLQPLNRRHFVLGASAVLLAPTVSVLADDVPVSSDGFHILTAEKTTAPLLGKGSSPTPVWAYNGTTPGPVIRVKQGEKVKIRLINKLDQPTSIHWHGVRIDNAMDGVAGLTQEPVKPGESFDYEFIARDAGTYWYHTHNRAWEQLARGLYGMLIVEEPEAPKYRDINLVLDDWRLNKDGSFDERSMGDLHDWAHGGRMGNFLTVNGTPGPVLDVTAGERLRLRIVNVANSRIMQLDIADHNPWLIALDGHPVTPRKLQKGDLVLGPAQRVDLVVDAGLKAGAKSVIQFVSDRQNIDIATINYVAGELATPAVLTAPPALPVSMPHGAFDLAAAKTVDLNMTGGAMGNMRRAMLGGKMLDWRQLVREKRVWAFNGIAGDLDKPLVQVKKGETIKIDIVNDTAFPHAMHLHGHHFTVVAKNNMSIATKVWRDTEMVYPDEKISLAFVADNPGKWMFHCHMIEHQAGGMMTWIDVV